MASATLSAQEKQRELAVLLEQTEAQNQQRGQFFHPLPCPFGSELSLQCPLTYNRKKKRYFKPLSSSHFASQRNAFISAPCVVEDRLVVCFCWMQLHRVAPSCLRSSSNVCLQARRCSADSYYSLSDTLCSTYILMYLVKTDLKNHSVLSRRAAHT